MTTQTTTTTTVTVTRRTRGFSFAFGPATTAGLDLRWETRRTTIGALRPERDMENMLLLNGHRVLAVEWGLYYDLAGALRDSLASFGEVELTVEVEPFRHGLQREGGGYR